MIKVFQIAYFKLIFHRMYGLDGYSENEGNDTVTVHIASYKPVWPPFRISETSMTADRCKQRSCSFYE